MPPPMSLPGLLPSHGPLRWLRSASVGVVAVVVGSTAVAQIAPSAAAAIVVVHAGSATAAPPPAGTGIWPGFVRTAASASGSASLAVQHTATTNRIDLDWQLACAEWATGDALAAGELRYELASSQAQVGVLTIAWTTSANGTGQPALAIDIGDDGVVDAIGSGAVPIAFGPGTLAIRVAASVQANAGVVPGPFGSSWSWSGSASATLHARYTASDAIVTIAAAATCAPAPALAARANFEHGVDLEAGWQSGADLAVFALGVNPSSVALPWSAGCTLLVDPIALPWLPNPANGMTTLSVAVPPAVRPTAFRAQLVLFDVDAPALVAGDVLSVVLP